METRSQSKQWAKVDTTLGTYMSPNRVWKEEGGEPEDRAPSMLLVHKSIKMGPPFAVYNEGTERLDILYFSKSVAQTFTQAWSLYQQSETAVTSGEAAPVTKPAVVATKPQAKPPLKRGALQSGSGGLFLLFLMFLKFLKLRICICNLYCFNIYVLNISVYFILLKFVCIQRCLRCFGRESPEAAQGKAQGADR